MRILAFDQASVISGYSIYQNKKLEKHGIINLSKEKDKSERYRKMVCSLENMIERENPDFVVVEDVALQTNASSLILLSRIQGAVQMVCYEKDIGIVIIKPSEWRKKCGFQQGRTINRKMLKEQAKQFVLDNYEIEVGEDEADAICIGYAVANTKKDGDNE